MISLHRRMKNRLLKMSIGSGAVPLSGDDKDSGRRLKAGRQEHRLSFRGALGIARPGVSGAIRLQGDTAQKRQKSRQAMSTWGASGPSSRVLGGSAEITVMLLTKLRTNTVRSSGGDIWKSQTEDSNIMILPTYGKWGQGQYFIYFTSKILGNHV